MKGFVTCCITGLTFFFASSSAEASPEVASYFEGTWIGEGYNCEQGGLSEKVQISISGNSLIARKVTGDNCVPAGNITFQGELPKSVKPGSSSSVTWTIGYPDNSASNTTVQKLTVSNDKSFTSFGVTFRKEDNTRKERIKVWFNTFIPTEIVGIAQPALCAHGDGRNFSSNQNASSRTHQMVELEVKIDGDRVTSVSPIATSNRNRIGESYFVDCKTGKQTGKSARASEKDIKNSWKQQSNNVSVGFAGRIGIPLLPSCPIDFDVNITYDPIFKRYKVVGGRDGFPAYEAYLQIGNKAPKQVFSYDSRTLGVKPASLDGLCRWDRRNSINSAGSL